MIKGKIAVIIDVLRASSTITAAIAHGAKGVIPVRSMGDASQIAAKIGSTNFLLCGEKDGVKIQDFDLGNSPLEYTKELVKDKTVVLTTTNGTVAIQQAQLASTIYIASFLNAQAIVSHLKAKHPDDDIVLICSGWKGRISIEDTLCAGHIIHELFGDLMNEDITDGAKVSLAAYHECKNNLADALARSNHAKRLRDIIENDDIAYCSQINIFDVLPTLKDGIIVDGKIKEG
jgi:2-phosphosulfolactate phosphatase